MTPERDPYRNTTSIGDIGELKLSDKIVFRVETQAGEKTPGLLGEASYNLYRGKQWLAYQPGFKAVKPQKNRQDWILGPRTALSSKNITVFDRLTNNKAVLKLPAGAFEIRRLPVSSLRINEFGAVKVEDGPDLIGYKILFWPEDHPLYGPPNRMDLEIPDQEQAALEKTVADMALPRDSPDLVLSGIKKYFLNNFQYSLVQTRTSSKQTPLVRFSFENQERTLRILCHGRRAFTARPRHSRAVHGRVHGR